MIAKFIPIILIGIFIISILYGWIYPLLNFKTYGKKNNLKRFYTLKGVAFNRERFLAYNDSEIGDEVILRIEYNIKNMPFCNKVYTIKNNGLIGYLPKDQRNLYYALHYNKKYKAFIEKKYYNDNPSIDIIIFWGNNIVETKDFLAEIFEQKEYDNKRLYFENMIKNCKEELDQLFDSEPEKYLGRLEGICTEMKSFNEKYPNQVNPLIYPFNKLIVQSIKLGYYRITLDYYESFYQEDYLSEIQKIRIDKIITKALDNIEKYDL